MSRFPLVPFVILSLAFVILLVTLSRYLPPRSQINPELKLAQQTLIDFHQYLNNYDYDNAVRLYDGDYQVLIDWNPEVPSDQKSQLWQNGCQQNGLQCFKIKKIISSEQISENLYRFLVQFQLDDGSLFVRGPCCGATEEEMPSVSTFNQEVVFKNQNYYVTSSPPYVP